MINSYLFVPGNQPEKISKAISGSAHAIMFDMEDSVSVKSKAEARNVLKETLQELHTIDKKIYVRINDFKSEFWEKDLKLVKEFDYLGLVVPLVETSEDFKELVNHSLSDREIIPIIETAKGIRNIDSILSADVNIEKIAFGVVDFCVDVNISFQSNNPLLSHSRIELVLASRANGMAAPIDSVYASFKDNEGFVNELDYAKKLGISSKLCIHPTQAELVNNYFSVNDKEYKWAKEVKSIFESAESRGVAAVSVNEEMIDYPIYKRALQILERHKKENL